MIIRNPGGYPIIVHVTDDEGRTRPITLDGHGGATFIRETEATTIRIEASAPGRRSRVELR